MPREISCIARLRMTVGHCLNDRWSLKLVEVTVSEHRIPVPSQPLRRLIARDGVPLAYRAHPVESPHRVAVLLHGTATDGRVMDPLAVRLQRDGIAVWVPDVRGHGGSGTRGDISHLGQLDDDLEDLVAEIERVHPGVPRALVGFSGGGAFVLRIAAAPRTAHLFGHHVLLAPAFAPPSKVARRNAGGWATPRLGRIVALLALNRLGIRRWNGATVLSFAVSEDDPEMTASYSYRLTMTFSVRHEKAALRRTRGPITLLAGTDDEQFHADRYGPELCPVRPDLDVRLIPGLQHRDLILTAAGVEAIAAAVLDQAAQEARTSSRNPTTASLNASLRSPATMCPAPPTSA